MTSQTCRCGRPVRDGFLCDECTSLLWRTLTQFPETLEELEVTRTRQARITHGGGSADHAALPWHNAASMVGEALTDGLWGLLRGAQAHRVTTREQVHTLPWPIPATDNGVAAWLAVRVDGIARHQDLADIAHTLVDHGHRAWRIIDRPPELSYAGQCDICGTHLYAVTGQPVVTCATCGEHNDVAMRRAAMLKAASDRLVTAREAATALTTLELPVTVERIRQWVHRRRLLVRGHTPDRSRLYRLGDIIDLLTTETTRAQTASLG